MLLAIDCPTVMQKAVSNLVDFEVVSAHRCQDDADYKAYFSSSHLPKVFHHDCNTAADVVSALAQELGCHLIITPRPQSFSTAEGIMGILTGKSFEDMFACIGVYLQGSITSVAVPYDILSEKGDTPQVMALRRVLTVSLVPPEVPVHLLGFLSLSELWWYRGRTSMSISTGTPVHLGLRDLDILEPLADKKVSSLDWFKSLPADKNKWGLVCRNVAVLRKYL